MPKKERSNLLVTQDGATVAIICNIRQSKDVLTLFGETVAIINYIRQVKDVFNPKWSNYGNNKQLVTN